MIPLEVYISYSGPLRGGVVGCIRVVYPEPEMILPIYPLSHYSSLFDLAMCVVWTMEE